MLVVQSIKVGGGFASDEAQNHRVEALGGTFASLDPQSLGSSTHDEEIVVEPGSLSRGLSAHWSALLIGKLSRRPSPKEIAEHVDESVEDVGEAMSAGGSFTPTALDAPVSGHSDGGLSPLGVTLGVENDGIPAAKAHADVEPLLRGLSERDRLVITLRFYDGLTQRETAEPIGVEVDAGLSAADADPRPDADRSKSPSAG